MYALVYCKNSTCSYNESIHCHLLCLPFESGLRVLCNISFCAVAILQYVSACTELMEMDCTSVLAFSLWERESAQQLAM